MKKKNTSDINTKKMSDCKLLLLLYIIYSLIFFLCQSAPETISVSDGNHFILMASGNDLIDARFVLHPLNPCEKKILVVIQAKYSNQETNDDFNNFFQQISEYKDLNKIDNEEYEIIYLIITNRNFKPSNSTKQLTTQFNKSINVVVLDRSLMSKFAPSLEQLLLSANEIKELQSSKVTPKSEFEF